MSLVSSFLSAQKIQRFLNGYSRPNFYLVLALKQYEQ